MKKENLYTGKTVIHRKTEKGTVTKQEVYVTWMSLSGSWIEVKPLDGGPKYWVQCSKLEEK